MDAHLTLSDREIRQLLGAIRLPSPFGGRDHAMLTLVLHTGLRVSELVGLDVHHVLVQGQPRQTLWLPADLGKGGKARAIPLNATARSAIFSLLGFLKKRGFSVAPEAPLLQNRFHRRLSGRDIQRLVKLLREAAGLDVPATPHTLRHAFASKVAQSHGNLRSLQQILGHNRLSSSQVYLHPTRDDLQDAVDSIG